MRYEDLYYPYKEEEEKRYRREVERPELSQPTLPPPPIGEANFTQPKLTNFGLRETKTTEEQIKEIPQPQPTPQPEVRLPETYSPELEALKNQLLGYNWFQGSPYAEFFRNIMTQLATPETAPLGMTEAERQTMINMARMNIAAQTQAQINQILNTLGGRGFRAGESGQVDTALASIMRGGQEQLGQAITTLMLDEARRRAQQDLALRQLNLSRLTAIPEFASLLEQGDLNRIQMALRALEAAGGLEQFLKQFGLQKEQLAASQAATAAAQELRERQFQYQQEMDALKLLLGLYGQETELQQSIFNPYWRAILGGL